MKKLIATLTALAAAMTMSVFAEKYISANDLTKGTIYENLACEDDFVITANEEKSVEIGGQSSDCPNTALGETFTQRIKLGSGKFDFRSITFPAKAGQTVTVVCKSSSKTDARVISVLNEAGEEVGTVPAGAYPEEMSVGKVKIPADGNYAVTPKKNTIYIYEVVVE
ncbi:MAG: hypothetical protein KBT11_02695 [Treponema sp.]|nr:hypothetical protein [Candidatus Treponema equifaecale]